MPLRDSAEIGGRRHGRRGAARAVQDLRLRTLAGTPYNAEMLFVMNAPKQDFALLWHVNSTFPQSMRFFADSYKSSGFAWPHFDQFLDPCTTQATGFRTDHTFNSLNPFMAAV